MKSDRFGINVKRFCREHEARVTAAVAAGEATEELLEEHLRMIAWVQHERLVHLIVTVMVVLCDGGAAGVLLLALLLPGEHRSKVVSDCRGAAGETKEQDIKPYTGKRR